MKSKGRLIVLLKDNKWYETKCDTPEEIHRTFEFYSIFHQVKWKDVIRYTLTNSDKLRDLKLGKLFSESPNSIYDFITSGLDFGKLHNRTYTARHGLLQLKVNEEVIYCYYQYDLEGCPSCGLDTKYGNPTELTLYMGATIDTLVDQCMTEREQQRALQRFGFIV